MDPYVRAFVKVNVRVDAGQRVWCQGQEIETFMSGSTRKVVLPCSRIPFSFDELKRMGAKVEVVTLQSLARLGGEGRWREHIAERRDAGLPSNVYIANARSIEYALAKGRTAPALKYVGRQGRLITEVYDTVDEVVDAMGKDLWRKEFSRGRLAKRK
jgi:hypothetical protein